MENTKENVLAVLQELAETAYTVSEVFRKQGNVVMAESLRGEYSAYTNAIDLLSNNTYFNEIREIVYRGLARSRLL